VSKPLPLIALVFAIKSLLEKSLLIMRLAISEQTCLESVRIKELADAVLEGPIDNLNK